jgi:DNA-binding NarL/FixJ family response regulator
MERVIASMGYYKSQKLNRARVVIADDHDLFRQILSKILEEEGMEVISTVPNGRDAVETTLKHKPDIVLMDIVMPEMDGLEALTIIKYICPEIPVFMITALEDPLYLARAGDLGAEGFFSKAVEPDELIHAIRGVLSGGKLCNDPTLKSGPIAPSIPDFVFPNLEPQSPVGENLTEKESLVLSFIAMGLDNPALMEKLHITKNTLKTHIRNIFSKLGVSNRTQAAVWAIQNGYTMNLPTCL